MDRLEADAKRGTSGASIQVTTVWSRWHVGGVEDIMRDLIKQVLLCYGRVWG
jgi:hypothetical protein